ncbi:MAG: substrate-binding domain-containing protein [Bacteroidota bacterium]
MKNLLKENYRSICFFTLVLFASCSRGEEQPKAGVIVEGETSGKVTILCDQSIYDLLKAPVRMFDSTYDEAEVILENAPARRAMGELLSGKAKGIIIARDYLADEDSLMKAYGVSKHERQMIAKDGLVFFTNRSFAIDTLNREQLKSVITAKNMTLKSMFPVLQAEPVFAISDQNSSEYANLLKLVTNGASPEHSFKTFQSTDSVKALVRSNPNVIGIGYLSHVALDTNFKLLKIGFKNDSTGKYVTPKIVHQSHIVMGNYPFVVPIYSFMLENRVKQPAWGLFSFLRTDKNVQLYFKNMGIVPAFAKFELIEE